MTKFSQKLTLAQSYMRKSYIEEVEVMSDWLSFENSDSDLLKSLEIDPDNAYVLNYLAYSWLERKYKINIALEMLERAYAEKSNDPYIIDSIGWAYYLIKDYDKS